MSIQGWISILEVIAFVSVGLIIKNYLPSYLDEKGKNLATKEDIAEITRRSEEVQDEYRREYEKFSSDMKFKYDFYYKQYIELYTKLYSIICQSEYLRRFFLLLNGSDFSFDKMPFIEIHKTKQVETYKFNQTGMSFLRHEDVKRDDITSFCKKELCDLIVNKGEYSSQRLLKLAVAYRFAYDNYSGNEQAKNSDVSSVANDEEFILITEIVKCIISEYNMLRKELKMDYIESELIEGKFKSVIIDVHDSVN